MDDAKAKGRLATGERSGSRTHPERVPRGVTNGMAKFTEDDIRKMRELSKEMNGYQIGKIFNTAPATVYRIISRKSWAHVE